jgi:Na+/H+ antiporter NhaA
MQIQYRTNPKTVGWARRAAIALLAGLGALLLSLPISFFLFLNHFQSAYPKDTQNLLSSLTASVVVGLVLALVTGSATIVGSVLVARLRPSPAS